MLENNGDQSVHDLAAPACFVVPRGAPWTGTPIGPGLVWATQSGIADSVGAWAFLTTGLPIRPPWNFLGLRSFDGQSGGLVIAHNMTPRDAELIVINDRGLRWTRPVVLAVAKWLYHDLGLARVTMRISADDRAALSYARRIGATLEGRQRRALANDADLVLFGMLRDEFPLHRFHRWGQH